MGVRASCINLRSRSGLGGLAAVFGVAVVPFLASRIEAAPAQSGYQFQPGACSEGRPAEGATCDANGIPSEGGFCELKYNGGSDSDSRVYRFQIPENRRKGKGRLTVTLRANPATGMIERADLSTVASRGEELRKGYQRTQVCTAELVEKDLPCGEIIVNPSLEGAVRLGDQVSDLQADDYSAAEIQDFAYERQLQGWIDRAGLSECDFYQNHLAVSGGAGALTEAGVGQFFDSCEAASPSGEAATTGLGCRAQTVEEQLGVPIEGHTHALALASGDLNQELIQELRSGLLKTLTAIRLSSPEAVVPSEQTVKSWTRSSASSSCAAESNSALEEEAKRVTDAVQDLPEGARETNRQSHALQTALDLLEWKQRVCANSWLQVGLGMADGRSDDRQRMSQIEGQNKVVELMSTAERREGYEKVKALLFTGDKEGLFGLKASHFEDRYACNNSRHRYRLAQLRQAVERSNPEVQAFSSALGERKGEFSSWLQARKDQQAKRIEQQLADATAMCAEAKKPYDTGWFTEDGLALWNNRTLVESVVRRRIAEGEDVSVMAAAYCAAKKDFDTQTGRENNAVLGMTAAAILAAPVAGTFELGGLAVYGVYGLGTAAGLTSAAVSVHNVGRTYDDLLAREMALSAGFAKTDDVSEAESAFQQSLLLAALEVVGGGVDGVLLSINLGDAIRASRAKKIDDSLMALAQKVERGELSSAELADFARKCSAKSKDCAKWVEAQVASVRAQDAAGGTSVASAEGRSASGGSRSSSGGTSAVSADASVARAADASAADAAAARAAAFDRPVPLEAPVQAQLRTKHKTAYDMVPAEDHDLVDAIAAELYRKYSPGDYQKLMKGELVADSVQRQVKQELEEITTACAMPPR